LFKSSEFLSKQLESCIEDFHGFYEGEGNQEEIEASKRVKMFQKVIDLATCSLEGFPKPFAQKLVNLWRQQPDIWRWAADDFYSREAVEGIAGRVGRFVRLSPVLVGVIPAKEVTVYLREGTRCFIYGFFQAAVSLCRAALEAGLNDHFQRKTGATPQMDLNGKIRGAVKFKLINPKEERLAERIRKVANRVLHEESVKEKLAFGILRDTREFLTELYGA
jgi:hypothetical protein